ncbi:MAG: ATP-binding protein, partial [Polyangiaceae bacterium]
MTAAKAAERASREVTDRFRALFRASRDGLVLLDANTRWILEANPSFCAMLGYAPEALDEKFFDQLFPAKVALSQRLQLDQARQTSGSPLDIDLVHAEGRIVTTEIVVSSSASERGPVDHYVVRDVTERRAVAERALQAQKMEAVGQLASGVAHELNNVLMVISTVAETLPSHGSTEVVEARNDLLDTARRGRDVIAALMTTARRGPALVGAFDLVDTTVQVVHMMKRLVPANVSVTFMVPSEPVLVSGDAAQIHQALLNLAINARDALPNGGEIQFHVTQQGATTRVSVRDNGVGMAPEVRRRALEPFFTTKPVGQGTGLGLSTVYAVVNHHRGTVTIDSVEGSGTTVTLEFPLAEASPRKLNDEKDAPRNSLR